MSKKADLDATLKAWKKDVDSEPFNSGELERKAREQAEKDKGKK